MSRVRFGCLALLIGAWILTGTFSSDSTVSAQQAGGEPARISTVDGIRLNALFFPADKKTSPTVIMLHPIGEGKNIRMPGWKALATALQKAGYAVMMFDFRGHGESTTIDDPQAFFTYAKNRSIKLRDKETIDYKDYKSVANSYLPVLVNDIAAVKAYLDRKNDAGVCNTSSTIVIGAEQGATLGAIWTNSEWGRYKYSIPRMAFQPEFDKRPEGKDIIASVYLTAQPKLGTRQVSLGSTLKIACKEQAMATLLFYGKDDPTARTYAKALESALKPKGTKEEKRYKFIGTFDLPTKLSGVQLLQDGLKTDGLIVQYLDGVVMDRGNEWVERDAQSALSMWRFPPPVEVAKKQKGEKNLEFNDYQKYVQ